MAQSKKILCVDDEESPLFLRRKVLEKAGYVVYTAASAGDAETFLNNQAVDLVITDQLMPGVVGTELARSLKKSHPELPIILLSGVNDLPEGAENADLFVSKLEGPLKLCEKVRELLDYHYPSVISTEAQQ